MRDLADPFRVVHGALRDAQATAFAIVKNEMYFVRSFLDHHRQLGVDQFIILDDRSTDGTRELLVAQPDCLVIESPFAFGEPVTLPGPDGGRRMRAGIAFKSLIPQRYLAGRYGLYLDADEYLILPAGVASVVELLDLLERNEIRSVAAGLIDFFPATVTELDVPRDLPTSAAMLAAHPYFDAVPLLGARPGKPWPAKVSKGTTARLLREHGIKLVPDPMRRAPGWLNRLLPYRYPTSSVLKTPIVRWDPGVEYLNSHRANVPASDKVLLGLAHLKFTHDLARRIDYALASKAYVRGSEKYLWYAQLLESMRCRDPSFLGPHSRRYEAPQDLAAAGLTRLDLA
jgi:hypothetical protein